MDSAAALRDTPNVLGPGSYRHRLARTLNAAYAEGLLSERTLTHRLDLLFANPLIEPARLIGDLTRRMPGRRGSRGLLSVVSGRTRSGRAVADVVENLILLALDWSGAREELVIGRHPSCDVVVTDETVSRQHARLTFRDGGWIVQDLDSTNGTRVNGQYVGRCRLRPGDQLALGTQLLRVD
jgi:FHA domain